MSSAEKFAAVAALLLALSLIGVFGVYMLRDQTFFNQQRAACMERGGLNIKTDTGNLICVGQGQK